MAHPKRKISKTRRDKRRTHYKASNQQLATCPNTGEDHLYHRAHWHDGNYITEGGFLLIILKTPIRINTLLSILFWYKNYVTFVIIEYKTWI